MYRLIIAGAMLAVPTLAAADGYEGSMKDGAPAYAYSYSVKQQRGSWTCPPEFSRKECSRIRQEVARRQARESRPRKMIVERRIPVYRDSRPVRAAFGGKRCIGRVTVTGPQRPTEGLARGAGWKEWRSVVRATAGGGEAFMDDRYAIGERVRCHITGSSRFLKRCEVSAVPCR